MLVKAGCQYLVIYKAHNSDLLQHTAIFRFQWYPYYYKREAHGDNLYHVKIFMVHNMSWDSQ